MRIAVFGLGYVGCVTGACLARMGHEVCGVDISPLKVRMMNLGRSPVLEKGLASLVSRMVRAGRLRATLEPEEAARRSHISLISVGTPSRKDGSANVNHVLRAVSELGRALRSTKRFHTVVVRSTIPPGTMASRVIPALERSSRKRAGRGFGVCFQPEFLREGSSLHDFFHPSRTVIGGRDSRSLRRVVELWRPIRAPLFITSLEVAEMVKYVDNAFHALKVAFANEVGALARSLGMDSHEVMDIFVQDRKLNISPAYLKPGFAFGGPCLPKDLRALSSMARRAGLEIPLLASVLGSNRTHLERAAELVLSTKKRRIGVLGLVFKSETDDLRESPACALVKRLLRAKRTVKVFDPRLQLGRLTGANRAFAEKELPQLSRMLLKSSEELVASSEVVVIAGTHLEFQEAARRALAKGKIVVDLVRLASSSAARRERTLALCW